MLATPMKAATMPKGRPAHDAVTTQMLFVAASARAPVPVDVLHWRCGGAAGEYPYSASKEGPTRGLVVCV